MSKTSKYKETTCPFCATKVKIRIKVGKVTCHGCHGVFYVGYDTLKHAWVSTDPESPIQGVFIQGARKDKKEK